MRHGERLHFDRADPEPTIAADLFIGIDGVDRPGCPGRGPDRDVTTLAERPDAATVITVLVRDQHGIDILDCTADVAETLPERPHGQATVNHDQSLAVLDEQRIASAATRERAKAQRQPLLRTT